MDCRNQAPSSYTVGGALGPVLGGFMLQHFWWGSVFLLAVPVMLLLLALGPVLLPEYKDGAARPLDVQSAALSLIAHASLEVCPPRRAKPRAIRSEALPPPRRACRIPSAPSCSAPHALPSARPSR